MPKSGSSMSRDGSMELVALGLGGNVGDPRAAMADALRELGARSDCRVVTVSRLYATPPWGKTDQAEFLNCCALIETLLHPEPFLDVCLDMERRRKRERVERWGPRTIDIDILTYGDSAYHSETLELPHPRMTARGFVMMPLADVAPEMVLGQKNVRDWLAEADIEGIRIADADRDWWITA
ncbi:2-amino-4-hydroxy-6-hydroxymethyldihydropteridine diphosphokinase [uncultured Rhizobium sp.]|uniref:2-amino-4-hydroxy-6- hydroxymethyldihydropteridine diphosphokinase n=1 Tax=Neorhizobium sp. DAR64872/K0K18 TaxID=3421958 RepID=UPI002D7EB507|nr:2-amino-4-hydroxy-6-hydroxymethyldihydropteridine diphosphokinase [uncultured Rhizobium sp.]